MTHPLDVSEFKSIGKSDLYAMRHNEREDALDLLYERKLLLKK